MGDRIERGKQLGKAHDLVNVFSIGALLVMSGLMLRDVIYNPPPDSKHSYWCLPLAYSTAAYLVLDTIFLVMFPISVPTTSRLVTLLIHHITTLALVYHPIVYTEHEKFLLYGLAVELNTMSLSLFKTTRMKLFQYFHFVTWALLRLGWYPYLLFYRYHVEMNTPQYSRKEYAVVLAPQAVLVMLGLLWTYEAVQPSKAKQGDKKESSRKTQ